MPLRPWQQRRGPQHIFGTCFINAQPRFGIYRDWRAETQTIYFDKIMFWNTDPSGHPDWGVSPPPG
jgi:hypothetical protein